MTDSKGFSYVGVHAADKAGLKSTREGMMGLAKLSEEYGIVDMRTGRKAAKAFASALEVALKSGLEKKLGGKFNAEKFGKIKLHKHEDVLKKAYIDAAVAHVKAIHPKAKLDGHLKGLKDLDSKLEYVQSFMNTWYTQTSIEGAAQAAGKLPGIQYNDIVDGFGKTYARGRHKKQFTVEKLLDTIEGDTEIHASAYRSHAINGRAQEHIGKIKSSHHAADVLGEDIAKFTSEIDMSNWYKLDKQTAASALLGVSEGKRPDLEKVGHIYKKAV
jgi:hypothetical protein